LSCRSMNPNLRRILFPLIVVVVFLVVRELQSERKSFNSLPLVQDSVLTSVTSTNALIVRAVDGDTVTVLIDGQSDEVKVRLLGVNTPESVDPRRPVQCFGREASKFLASLLENRRVRLDPDMQADEVDKYGRLLRNVVREDGLDVNVHLIREGYANAYVSFPMNKDRKTELKRLEEEARQSLKGLWSPTTCSGLK